MLQVPVLVDTLNENLQCLFKFVATKPDVIENRICVVTDCLKAA